MMKKKIALIQLNVDFASEYLPYSVGLLEAYAKTFPNILDHFEFLPAIYKRPATLDTLTQQLTEIDILGLSTYVWNTQINLALAKQLKKLNPQITILMGGPNIPDHAESFLQEHPYIDFTIHGEGEVAFTAFLQEFLNEKNFENVPSLRFIQKKSKQYIHNPKAPRIENLDSIPSPYLSGIFDSVMKNNPQQTWNALWETNRGCPFSCTYCDWGSATQSKVLRFSQERVEQELDWFQKNKIEYLMCTDANFGIFERDLDICKKMATLKKEAGFPTVFAATYTKNATERSYSIARILMDAGLIRGYTVSTQSVHADTLSNIRRTNISQKTFIELQSRFNKDKLPTYTDLIIGLPGETLTSFKEGISTVIDRGQFNKCYFIILSILPNAQMSNPEYKSLYGFETVWIPQKNLHEKIRSNPDEISEMQELVIATKSMPREDWRKAVSYAWLVSFLYFNKLLHIPFTLLHSLGKIPFSSLVEPFEHNTSHPFLKSMQDFFYQKAYAIQMNGEIEYCSSSQWLPIWWQPDKIAFMEACKNIQAFYSEAKEILENFVKKEKPELLEVVQNALDLNQALIKSPFHKSPSSINLSSNLYECYLSILEQNPIPLQKGVFSHTISNESWDSIDDWCKKVVWFGNKTSAYLRSCSSEKNNSHLEQIRATQESKQYSNAHNKPYLYS